ncbi:hypothetical protein BHS05_27050 [Myxococcus xanthus]|nr:hypothetical protein BHS05_27050 [Myxococcus xanthus]
MVDVSEVAGPSGQASVASDDPRSEARESSTGVQSLPWDRRAELGLGKAFRLTCKEVMLRPATTFGRMEPEGSVGSSLLFALLCFCVLYLPSGGLYTLLGLLNVLGSPYGSFDSFSFRLLVALPLIILGVAAVLSPVATLVVSGVEHLLLRMAGVPGSFRMTLRRHVMSQGVSLVGLLPFFALPVSLVWATGVRVMAYRSLSRSGWVRASVAVLLPALVMGGLGLWGYRVVTEPWVVQQESAYEGDGALWGEGH